MLGLLLTLLLLLGLVSELVEPPMTAVSGVDPVRTGDERMPPKDGLRLGWDRPRSLTGDDMVAAAALDVADGVQNRGGCVPTCVRNDLTWLRTRGCSRPRSRPANEGGIAKRMSLSFA